jgi:serine/threonine-protein kinase
VSASPEDLVGRTLDGRYRIESIAARGGMATIFLAIDLRLQRPVAVKVMHQSLADDANFITRFEREARAAASLTHPNVVSVHDQGRDEATGAMYLIMELVAGHTIRDVLVERKHLTPVQALAVLDPVLQALDAAHKAGFVHRDIKPENVMIADDGRVRVADFGLARAIVDTESTALTRGVLIGTVAYLAPEQVEKGQADERSDIYSAGILLFEMLTGKVPFSGDSPIAVAFQHVHANMPMPSDLQPGLSTLLDIVYARATTREPERRYQSAEAFLSELRQVRDIIEGKADAQSFHGHTPEVSSPNAQETIVLPIEQAQQQSFGFREAELPQPEKSEAPLIIEQAEEPSRRLPSNRTLKLVAAITTVALIAFGAFHVINQVTVPQLVGKNVDQALSDLSKVQLHGVVADEVFNEITAAGTVLSAEPKSGESLSKNSDVKLVVSKGPEKVAVPNLAGLSNTDAIAALTSARLALGSIAEEFSETAPLGTVISSSPASGKKLSLNALVNLTISKGPKPIKVPSVKGKVARSAVSILKKSGFTSVVTQRQYSNSVPRDRVIAISPEAGTAHSASTIITVTVSNGPPPVKVPSVTNYTKSQAIAKITSAGLKVKSIIKKCTGHIRNNYVQSQSPKAGVEVQRGTTVTITVRNMC